MAVLSPVAWAAESDQSPIEVKLTFTAPTDCARPEDFEVRVAVRSKRIRFVDDDAATTRITAEVIPGSGEVRVRLRLSNADGTSVTREFEAPDCAEGVDAIALVTAISLDRFAKTEPAVASEAPESETAESAATEPAPGGTAETPPESEPSPGAEAEAQELEEASSEAPQVDLGQPIENEGPSQWHGLFSGALEGLSGVAPVNVAGVSAGLGVWREGPLLAPMVRLVLSHFPAVTYPANGGDATFLVDAARLAVCPIRLGVPAYGLRPCLVGEGGRVIARGSQTVDRQSYSVPLWSGGGELLAVIRPTSTILIMGQLSVLLPSQRPAFRFEPDPEFHRISNVLVQGGFGFGLEFP